MRAGFACEGIEDSAALAELAEQQSGARVRIGLLETSSIDLTSYDNVVSIHVIEHVPDPVEHLRKARAIVRPGGVGVFVTPNAEGWEHRLLGDRSPLYSSAHLHLFSAEGFRIMLRASGWHLRRVGTLEQAAEWPRAVRRVVARVLHRPVDRAVGSVIDSTGSRADSRLGLKMLQAYSWVSAPLRVGQEALHGGNELFVVAQSGTA
jgi:SAM-dependent methyltransferase